MEKQKKNLYKDMDKIACKGDIQMENPNYWAVLPAAVRYDEKLKANEKLLYSEISALSNRYGECWASNNYFAKLYKVDPSTISRWVTGLELCGYVTLKYIYKENSKAVDKRVIQLNEVLPNINRVLQKNQEGYCKKVKENNTSINNKKEEEGDSRNELKKVINFYENNITLITPFVSEDMEKYLQDGLQADLIIACMKEAVSRNKRNWHYVVSILNDCCNNNIKTAEQFYIKQKDFKSNNNNSTKQQQTKEKVEYEEIHFENEEEYRKELFKKQKG